MEQISPADFNHFSASAFGCQSLVMGVNHRGGIARLRGGQVFVAVQGKMKEQKPWRNPLRRDGILSGSRNRKTRSRSH
jgi:hypothetical protein